MYFDVNNLYDCVNHVIRWFSMDRCRFWHYDHVTDSLTGYVLEVNLEYSNIYMMRISIYMMRIPFCPTREKPDKRENKLLVR